jgi:diguanylate cyclase (GGDEF)-like protein
MQRLTPSVKVIAVSVVMLTVGIGLIQLLPRTDDRSTSLVVALAFVAAFAVSEATVFHLEIRRQAHTFSLGEAVIVIGLFTLSPLALVGARLVGAGAAMTARKIAPVKLFFNLCLAALEIALAVTVMWLIAGTRGDLAHSIGAVVAVAIADVVGVCAVWMAISIFEGTLRRRQVFNVLQAQMFVTLIAGSVGVVGALALASGSWIVLYLGVIAVGAIGIFRKYAQLTSRHAGLQSLHDFSRGIADDLNYLRVLQTAMTDLVDIINATTVVGIVLKETSLSPVGVYSVRDECIVFEPLAAPIEEYAKLASPEPKLQHTRDIHPAVSAQLGIVEGQVLSGDLALRDLDHLVFVATKSSESFGVLDEESIEQAAAMSRYVSATLKNGIMVEEIERSSRLDGLTGLLNRSELERIMSDLESVPGHELGLVVISMDDLREINETLGHNVGDEVVGELAIRFGNAVADESVAVARLEGASFAAVYPGHNVQQIVERALGVLDKVEGDLQTKLSRIDVRCVAGVAVSTPETDSPAQLIRWADLALSEARRIDQPVGVYSSSLDREQQRRVRLVGDLRHAIAAGEFELYYQPKMSLSDSSVCGAEALIRWQHSEFGFVAPDEFITLAETTGIISEVSMWVLRTAVAQAAEWRRRGIDIEVAVNLSPVDLLDEGLPARIAHLIELFDLPAHRLGLELTETAVMADQRRVIATLGKLRAAGHKLYVDDYGTGQSSLAYLKSLPVDALKIDRAFVSELADNRLDEVIVKNTVELAHELGLAVVAEGIEDQGAFDVLRSLGCEYAQGFFMSKPLPADDLEEWIADSDTLSALLESGRTWEEPAREDVDPTAVRKGTAAHQ